MRLKILAILALFINLSCATEKDISVQNAWIRSAPANAQVIAAFMTIKNPSNQNVNLVKVQAAAYGSIELHRTTMKDGMMKMSRQERIPIPAKDHVTLEPGSWHIMLIKPQKVPTKGEVVKLSLHFDNNAQVSIEALVKSADNL